MNCQIAILVFGRRFHPEILVKSLRGCEKWILQKISHRSSNLKKNETFFFHRKKINLDFWKNIFSKMRKIRFSPSVEKIFFIKKIYNWLFGNFFKFEKYFFKFIFFRCKKKVSKFFGLLYRCEIFWRIHFSHPRSDLTSISGWNPLPKEKIMILSSKSEVWMADATLDDKSEFWMIFFRQIFKNIFFDEKKSVIIFWTL